MGVRSAIGGSQLDTARAEQRMLTGIGGQDPLPRAKGDSVKVAVITFFDNHPNVTCTARMWIPGTGMTGVESLYSFENASVYPDPNPGRFTVRLNLDAPQPITMQVRDVLGHIVHETSTHETAGEHSFTVELGDVPSGVYVLENIIGTKRSIRRVSVLR